MDGSNDAEEPRLLESVEPEVEPTEFLRDLGIGREGKGPVGGLSEGRDGRGRVVVAMITSVVT